MPLPSDVLPTTTSSGGPLDLAACDVCPHVLDGHDAIGRRFCQATLESALTRGCICRS